MHRAMNAQASRGIVVFSLRAGRQPQPDSRARPDRPGRSGPARAGEGDIRPLPTTVLFYKLKLAPAPPDIGLALRSLSFRGRWIRTEAAGKEPP
jgi:hypothetical protein